MSYIHIGTELLKHTVQFTTRRKNKSNYPAHSVKCVDTDIYYIFLFYNSKLIIKMITYVLFTYDNHHCIIDC